MRTNINHFVCNIKQALSVSSALNGNPFCADHGGAAIVSGAI